MVSSSPLQRFGDARGVKPCHRDQGPHAACQSGDGDAADDRRSVDRLAEVCCGVPCARSGRRPAGCRRSLAQDRKPVRRSSKSVRLAALHGRDLGDDGERDLGLSPAPRYRARSARECARCRRGRHRLAAAARRAWHGFSGCPARRYRRHSRLKRRMSAGSSIFGSWLSTTTAVWASRPILASASSGQSRAIFTPGKRSSRGESRARIDDHHAIADRPRHGQQGLRDMHRADDDQADRRA